MYFWTLRLSFKKQRGRQLRRPEMAFGKAIGCYARSAAFATPSYLSLYQSNAGYDEADE
jgi:hypothetical protein